MVITKLLRPLYIAKPLTSTKRAFSTNFRQPLDLKDLKRSKVNTTFVEPLEDFEFQSEEFAQIAMTLANQTYKDKKVMQQENEKLLEQIRNRIIDKEDPFKMMEQDLQKTKEYAINNILRTDYKQLEEPALYNMNLKGKNFRSAILFMLSRAIYNNDPQNQGVDFSQSKKYEQVKALAACIEIAHNASLLQDDIIDKADSRRSSQAAHKVFGASNSVFSSDYMISRASRMLTVVFDTTHISQLFSTVLFNLVFGELIQAKRDMKKGKSDEVSFDLEDYFSSYISKTYFKTASMISLGCRGVGVIFELDQELQRMLFNFGANLGIAFQIHDDILDFTQDSQQLGKPAYNDIKEGIITAPLIYSMLEYQKRGLSEGVELEKMILRKFEEKGDVAKAVHVLESTSGIEVADRLSIEHIYQSISNLEQIQLDGPEGPRKVVNLETERFAQALMAVALKAKTRKY